MSTSCAVEPTGDPDWEGEFGAGVPRVPARAPRRGRARRHRRHRTGRTVRRADDARVDPAVSRGHLLGGVLGRVGALGRGSRHRGVGAGLRPCHRAGHAPHRGDGARRQRGVAESVGALRPGGRRRPRGLPHRRRVARPPAARAVDQAAPSCTGVGGDRGEGGRMRTEARRGLARDSGGGRPRFRRRPRSARSRRNSRDRGGLPARRSGGGA